MKTITLATEDELSEAVGIKLIASFCHGFTLNQRLRGGGNGYLRKRLPNLHAMAGRGYVMLITDLDTALCPSALIDNWRGQLTLASNLLFRVAVREVESWLLADHDTINVLLDGARTRLPDDPDALINPKQTLLRLASKAPRTVRGGTLCRTGNGRKPGRGI